MVKALLSRRGLGYANVRANVAVRHKSARDWLCVSCGCVCWRVPKRARGAWRAGVGLHAGVTRERLADGLARLHHSFCRGPITPSDSTQFEEPVHLAVPLRYHGMVGLYQDALPISRPLPAGGLRGGGAVCKLRPPRWHRPPNSCAPVGLPCVDVVSEVPVEPRRAPDAPPSLPHRPFPRHIFIDSFPRRCAMRRDAPPV